ncbi:MAG: peptidase [Methanomicrobia archaeon]|nr:peptidase [Methanomicrobia archaeon]
MRKIAIYHPNIDMDTIISRIRETYTLDVINKEELELPSYAYDPLRKQYYAPKLLDHLFQHNIPAFWIIKEDIFTDRMNFIFGLAIRNKGAVVSIYRLENTEIIVKEVIHEVGHYMGLGHCSNDCVMQFSNSLWEALQKPSTLCSDCKRSLGERR